MNIYNEKFFRNQPTINVKEQEKIRKTKIAIVGLGGTGGVSFECLLRAGAEKFILFDSDRFELTNFNRQILSSDDALDRKKVAVATERAKTINRNVRISGYGKFNKNKIKNAHIVIDATDNVKSRLDVFDACSEKPYILCSAGESFGMVSVFIDADIRKIFQLNATEHKCASILAPAAFIAGSLAASYAINLILKKPVIRAPDVIFFNLFAKKTVWVERLV